MPQFETVEDFRGVPVGGAGTLIPSWNNGFVLRSNPEVGDETGAMVRPGQRLVVLEAANRHLRVRQDAQGHEGWIPAHVVAPWPDPLA